MAEPKDVCSSLPARAPKSATSCRPPIDRRTLGVHVTGGKAAGRAFWKHDVAQGHSLDWWESNRTETADKRPDPESGRDLTRPEVTVPRRRGGSGAHIQETSALPKIAGIAAHSLAWETTQPIKLRRPHLAAAFTPCHGPPSVQPLLSVSE